MAASGQSTLRAGALLVAVALGTGAQVCRLSVAGLNQSRRVMGPVHAECAGDFVVHSSPFGNWGVTSNFGPKRNGDQFQGWCRNMTLCDSMGMCRSYCKDGWFEWNSCTEAAPFQAPNCSLYNGKDCTEQVSTTGVNVLGTQTVDLPVRCPLDTDRDGAFDAGGCKDVLSYSHGSNFMSLYELDPGAPDELIQTLYFPATVVHLNCTVFGCPAAGSEWVAPVSYDTPSWPPRVYAQMAMVVNSGTFVNTNNACRLTAASVASVCAASLSGPRVARGSIVTAFGQGLAAGTAAASATPLPEELGGVKVTITDATGAVHAAHLFFVSPRQINYLAPETAAVGLARVTVTNAGSLAATGTVEIDAVAPGLFAANAGGQGIAAAVAEKISAGGARASQLVFQCGSAPASCVAVPVDLGSETDEVFLLLFGTGIRGAGSGAVSVRIGGLDAEVLYAGPQPAFEGLDQVNVRLPRALAGKGEVDIVLSVDGRTANGVSVNIR